LTLKIEKTTNGKWVLFTLSGRIEAQHIAELRTLLAFQAVGRSLVLDLREIRLVDRDAVQFLARCEADGIKLENCPAYIAEWIAKEEV